MMLGVKRYFAPNDTLGLLHCFAIPAILPPFAISQNPYKTRILILAHVGTGPKVKRLFVQARRR
jgi:hypothetical protein